MDNRIFNVNGKGREQLAEVMRLAFLQKSNYAKAVAYKIDPQKGMILLWHNTEAKGITGLPAPLTAEDAAVLVSAWLETRPNTECSDWDADAEHDGDNELGWRVYCEDWGHVAGERFAICAVKPAWLWYGK